MRQTLSIAVLSRNSDDLAFVNGTLRDAGHAARCHQIKSPEAFSRSLEDESLELIILSQDEYTDSVRAVIKQRNAYRPEIPLIALRKSLDETSMQAAIEAGANDLVSRESKSRLQAVVNRELRTLRMEKALNSTMSTVAACKQQINDYMQDGISAIAYVDEGVIVDANSAWLSLFEVSDKSEMLGRPLMDNFALESQAAVKGAVVATANGKWRQSQHLSVKARLGGSGLCDLLLELRLINLHDIPHVQIRAAARMRDVSERNRATLLHDHKEIIRLIKDRLQKKPKSGLHILAYIKPDGFSSVRKAVGGLNTDAIVTQFVEEVSRLLHPDDVAGRFEETVVLALLERGNERDAAQWARSLVKSIQTKVFEAGDQTITLTCTVGLCAVSGAFSSLEELLSAADEAHSRGRQSGGNTVFVDQVTEANARVIEYDEIWVKHIKSALIDNRFRLVQLPIAGLRADNARMLDILIRMLDEQGDEVLPSEFLPSAQRNNLTNAIDRWVIDATMGYCSKDTVERAFVRLSTQSVLDTTLTGWIEQRVDDHEIDPSRLCFQVPADDAAKYVRQTQELSDLLRRGGYRFAVEHYATNYHSHQILDILKPHYIKIDGEHIHTLASDRELQASVQRLMHAAKERGIETIAERVESASVMAVLFQLGVHFMQGHYVHEPEIVL